MYLMTQKDIWWYKIVLHVPDDPEGPLMDKVVLNVPDDPEGPLGVQNST